MAMSSGDLSTIFGILALFSAMLWIYYAMNKTNLVIMITINAVSLVIQIFYISFYIFYAPKKEKRKKENHLFKWVDEALLDEIERMAEHQARVDEEIEDLRISMKKTVQKEVMNHKHSLDVGCVGTLFSLLCLWSKCD
ncbi:hypothetical protein F2Q68_00010362 [Brassica cretica]|uniref:Bidirectional sugar transporter SWEET n=1 Tax=Brassica cretica TaxID=69181 RepID=A0A8S9L2H3_BRACR|nr:hypothetical protein F2Q68_00010362 [Brassica cretica]